MGNEISNTNPGETKGQESIHIFKVLWKQEAWSDWQNQRAEESYENKMRKIPSYYILGKQARESVIYSVAI